MNIDASCRFVTPSRFTLATPRRADALRLGERGAAPCLRGAPRRASPDSPRRASPARRARDGSRAWG